ncbi:MAG: hypothetical protein ACE5RJ_05290 [Nitrosopumilaceae archaeon]
MGIERSIIILLVMVVGILVTAVSIYDITTSAPLPMAQFTDASIMGPNFEIDVVPKLKVGEYAVITVGVEKLSQVPINDIVVKSYLEDPQSMKFLFIDSKTIHPAIIKKDLEVIGNTDSIDQFDAKGKTETILIKVMATNSPPREFDETVNVVLYADGKEMDRFSFDVIVKSS